MAESLDARAERLGRLAFDSYADSVGGISAQGLPIPPWESLPQHIRAAWVYAALAVANAERAPAAAAPPKPAPGPRTCNRHKDCDAADAEVRAKGRLLYADHCHDDTCEDCFGS